MVDRPVCLGQRTYHWVSIRSWWLIEGDHLPRRDSDRGMRIDPRGSMNAAHCPCCTLWFNSYVQGRGALIVRWLLESFSSKYHGFQPERETRWIFKLPTSVLDVVRPSVPRSTISLLCPTVLSFPWTLSNSIFKNLSGYMLKFLLNIF